MRPYYSVLNQGKEILREGLLEEAEVDARLLLLDICNMTSTDFLLKKSDKMPEAQYNEYMRAIAKRKEHIPLQYITGRAYFMGYEFTVNENVLIPRFDTENLVCEVEKIIKKSFAHKDSVDILDMCTGSGCIIISLALRNNINGAGVDISRLALEAAKHNSNKLEASGIEFIESNLFENVVGEYDIIVSNPPYIRTKVIQELEKEVKEHEPFGALDGHEDGLYFYELITQQGVKFLKTGGYLCYEIGFDQGNDVVRIMKENGFTDCKVVKDLAGLDRVVTGKKQ